MNRLHHFLDSWGDADQATRSESWVVGVLLLLLFLAASVERVG